MQSYGFIHVPVTVYAVLGKSGGKLNNLFLVRGRLYNFGVATAALTAAILNRYFNRSFDEREELIKKNNQD